MPFLVKTKPKIDISFGSKSDKPHNTPQHVIYHRDLDVRSILVYWDTLKTHLARLTFQDSPGMVHLVRPIT